MKRGAVCLLLFLPVQAIVSRRQASNSSRPALDSCACSCCAASQRSTGLSCVPRGDGCRLCAPGAVLQASFAALHNEVDYSRYCFAACQPLSSTEDAPCEERENSLEAQTQQTQLLRAPNQNAAAPAAAPAAVPLSASELEHTGEVAAESLAEVALLRAQRHAREAKQSAALARYAYEKLAKSREEASEAAGQAALEDVILDARKDAGEAVKIRAGWEDAARAHAAQKAVVAAAVYKKAKLRDLQVAEAWEKQATLLLKTSRQYEEYAARQEMKEKKLKQALKKLEAPETSALLQGVAAPAPAPFREAPVLGKSLEPTPQVAQAPMAAFAPPPATASGMVEGIAQAPVAAAAPPPASAMGPSGVSGGADAKAEPSSAAAPAPASAVEVEGSKLESKEEGEEEKSKEEGKEKSKKESKEESKEEAKEEAKKDKSKEEKEKSKEEKSKEEKSKEEKSKEEKSKEEKSKEEKSKEEKSKEEKSKEEGKKEGKEEKSKEEGKDKSKKDGKESEEKRETEAKAASAVPVAPAPAASPSAASIASSAIFGDAAKTPLVPFGGQDEKSRLLQELQVAEAQVDAGLKLAHEYELQAHAARKEAEGIRANASWYDGAEAAAAAHTLYAELPKGVIPPPLPALP